MFLISKMMWNQLLLLTCCHVSTTLGKSSSLSYLLLVPAEIHFPSNETVCVDVRGARENLKVMATLQYGRDDQTLLQEMVTESKMFKCVEFQTPPPEGGKEEVVSVHLSLVGPSTQMSDSKDILVSAVGAATLIQTDKPMYKPGQTVNIRIVTFNRDFKAVEDTFPLVEIEDPHKNRIGQWLSLKPQQGIIDISFPLDSEAQLGTYMIITPNAREDFHVAEYVLPMFETIMDVPGVISILEENLSLKVFGRYTYGKPVQGEMTVNVCRKAICYYWMRDFCPEDICTEYRGQTDKNGFFEVDVSTEPYQLRSYDFKMKLDINASLVENGTGVVMNSTASCKITAKIVAVTFDNTELSDSYYKIGLRYKTTMMLESSDGSPMKSQPLYLTEKYDNIVKEHVYETNEKGEAYITLNTRPWNGHLVYLTATYLKEKPERNYGELNPRYIDAFRTLQPFSAITKSLLKVQPLDYSMTCGKQHEIEIDYIIRSSEILSDEDSLEFHYMVVARGNLVTKGEMNVALEKGSGKYEKKLVKIELMMGTVILPLDVTAEISPLTSIFVYVILGNGKIAADTEKFQVEKCFNNKVTVDYSKNEVSPGSAVTLRINAEPGSLCSVKAVDEGVLLLKPEAEISPDEVYKFLSRRNQYGYPYRVREEDPLCWVPQISSLFDPFGRRKRSINVPPPSSPDVLTLLKQLGVKAITNTQIKKNRECQKLPGIAALNLGFGYESPVYDSISAPSTIRVDDYDEDILRVRITIAELTKRIRTKFPETWLWKLLKVGFSGQTDLQEQLPDSITEWKTTAFCMGDSGMGIAPTSSIKSFLPYFVEITYPYSARRGETMLISATVFNYMTKPMMVKLNREKSQGLKMNECPKCSTPQCLLPQQSVVYTWDAKAMAIGTASIQLRTEAIDTQELCDGERPIVPDVGASDSLMKTLLVKAEGIPIEMTHNSILCAEGSLSNETVPIVLPPDVVPDSATAVFSVVGDIMGCVLENIEQLLQLPSGCGEQTMVRFVPNIYLLDYLASANLLTEKIKKKATDYILHGYQREMKYRRQDGSFSTFGDSDDDGNTWLTAFVMKTLHAASRHIFVDKKYIRDTTEWLKDNQLPNGCFRNRGELFKTSMKGGVNDEVSLCSYISIALLESDHPLEDKMVQSALQSLRDRISLVDSLYTKSLLSYTFSLSRENKLRDSLLHELHEKAVKADGDTYWPANPLNPTKGNLWSKPNSNEVEIASYILLAHISSENTTKQDINHATSIARWISKQQNPNGGFANTQDTVIALQALYLLSKKTYSKHGGLDVFFNQDGDKTTHCFHVEEKNRLLLQKKQLTKLPGVYNVWVKGEGCVFLKTSLKYNMYPNKMSPFFDIKLNLTTGGEIDKSKLTLHYNISLRYTGPRKETNMVLMETELPSGFKANIDSLEKLIATNPLVRRHETSETNVILYLDKVTTDSINFLADRDFIVSDLKQSSIKAYDYYETGEESSIMYKVPDL